MSYKREIPQRTISLQNCPALLANIMWTFQFVAPTSTMPCRNQQEEPQFMEENTYCTAEEIRKSLLSNKRRTHDHSMGPRCLGTQASEIPLEDICKRRASTDKE
ncbi:hypothetical protein HYDPIDRAFT_44793 [Hydnomerulius pinastri MD-312]|uniref:Unplaced genomic scaffold scaffold_301, whole genome shotgun sequence n=1 Tax=Hydnomerulius pinastri MD-312 TaxID=994086 RepID=A0A0C9VWW8_9AGAM|nr:hypothetical protein HYDPIDRAFT_44793 [Hydnomerulius pinastri MD-312]